MIYEKEKTKNISFPLGGIGTGCIGLSGNGELNDWEIFNRPNKNSKNGYSHFAVKATRNGKSILKVLHGDTNENYMGSTCASNGFYGFGFGPREVSFAGFPHFKNLTFNGNFPVAEILFSDDDFPATVRLRAFNPFIPHDSFNSSIPAAFFEFEIENITSDPIEFALACTLQNPSENSVNREICNGNIKGLFFGCSDDTPGIGYTDLSVLTDNAETLTQEYWFRGDWKDGCTTYWKNLLNQDRMPKRNYAKVANRDHGTVVSYVKVAPEEKATLRFIIAWNSPVAHNYWTKGKDNGTWKNFYATQFKNSAESAEYALNNFDDLLNKTLLFSDVLQSCTVSDHVKDAVSANLSVLKSPTVLRLEDGSFWAWEGCSETVGSCHGTCQHVWNYAYAMPYLFPDLERSIRDVNLKYGLQDSGATTFRVDLPLEPCTGEVLSCVDGQMGEVIKCYREWKFSGDDEWIKKNAEGIFKMLEYAWSEKNPDRWDENMDGIMEGVQHHTLDMELFGPSSWLQGFYLLALACGAEIAEFVNETERAKLYSKLYEQGKKWTNENLFNGRYFYHKVDVSDKSLTEKYDAAHYWNEEAKEIKYQVADGCIIDQMLADWHSVLIGTKAIFDSDKKKTALEFLYENNYKSSMREVTNMWRNFSLNDESGTVICTYPPDVKVPAIPIPYCEETMTGFEYALAGLLIAEGYIREGETVVKAIRDRYDGEKRNPWNEIECGSNYARSMASFALIPIYSGFTFDMRKKHIGFAPKTDSGKYFFSACESWGTVEFTDEYYKISMCGKPLTLSTISIPNPQKISKITLDGKTVEHRVENGTVHPGDITIEGELFIETTK